MEDRENEEAERPRPRVIDKRISSGGSSPRYAPAPDPAPSADPPGATPAPAPGETVAPGPPPSPATADASQQATGAEPRRDETGAPPDEVWTPEQEAEARRMADEIVRTPSLEWVVNVAATLANVAGTKLQLGAAADAQLAIDALAALTKELGPRLQEAEDPLRRTLAQLQLAYAQRVASPGTPGSPEA